MVVILKDAAVQQQAAGANDQLQSIFVDGRVQANPRAWEAVGLKTALLVRELEARANVTAKIAFGTVNHGFAALMTPAQVDTLRADPRVAAVFEDALGAPAAADAPPWLNRPGFGPGYTYTYGWNLYAIGAINYVSDANPAANNPAYRTAGGYPVKAYVIDAGIQPHDDLNFNWQVDHVSFDCHSNVGGWCSGSADGSGSTYSYQPVCDSHGTHVAGIIGGIRQSGAPIGVEGVAPGAQLVSVRVINYCTGPNNTFPGLTYTSSVIGAINWVANKSLTAGGGHSLRTGAVANISILWEGKNSANPIFINGTAKNALRNAIVGAVNSGVFFSFAAGNSNQPSCDLLPAAIGNGVPANYYAPGDPAVSWPAVDGALTVGAIGHSALPMRFVPNDPGKIASYGACVEVWAPGQAVQSTGAYPGLGLLPQDEGPIWGPGIPIGATASQLYPGQHYYYASSGSSMAAPHGVGAALLLLQRWNQIGMRFGPPSLESSVKGTTRTFGSYGGYPQLAPPLPVNVLQVDAY